ncbi:DUF4047 domain-containing protein [Bacillus cereus group sp. BfR-BA-01380]|uniref:DUF4047 domain-containing protein n=1 Tax=Bacillus cereus group sp. BfR-BA-01380 TaxID=2920324 RepID=UPI001F577553|nr:DUF4047 domain-containing protein [Bacillus cereus group sp. BfR-BA-01380]
MTYTEASFLSQQKVEATLSTAMVFPKTIEKLTGEAKQHRETIFNHYNVINSAANGNETAAELENKLVTWKQNREVIKKEIAALQTNYTEIESYNNKAVEDAKKNKEGSAQGVLKYVQAGFAEIQSIRSEVDKQAVLQKVDERIEALEKQMNEENKKQVNISSVQPSDSSQQTGQPSKQEEKKQENHTNEEQLKKNQPVTQVPAQPEENKKEADAETKQ